MQVPEAKCVAVLVDEANRVLVLFHGKNLPFPCGHGARGRDGSCPRAHIPDGAFGQHAEARNGKQPDVLLRHGRFAADELLIPQARRAGMAGGWRGIFDQHDRKRVEGFPSQLRRRAGNNLLIRVRKPLADMYQNVSKTHRAQLRAYSRRGAVAAGEQKRFFMRLDLAHGIGLAAMHGDELCVLPRRMQAGAKIV